MNTAYANIMRALGPAKVDRHGARRLGRAVARPAAPGAGARARTRQVSVLDMASAYSTFADKGVHTDPVVISRVEDANGNVLLEQHARSAPCILSKDENGKVVYAMQQVIKGGTGTDADIGRPAAGKTGTDGSGSDQDSGNRDAWFVGYVPGFTAAVWMGNIRRDSSRCTREASRAAPSRRRSGASSCRRCSRTRRRPTSPGPTDLWGGKYLTNWAGPPATTPTRARATPAPTPARRPSTTAADAARRPPPAAVRPPRRRTATTSAPATTRRRSRPAPPHHRGGTHHPRTRAPRSGSTSSSGQPAAGSCG